MSIIQFFRIIWARRWVILSAPLVAFILAVVVVQVMPPKYRAESRVMLDIIKPDPVTGEVMSSPFLRAYTKTQTELMKDVKVGLRVVTDQNLANDPHMQELYRAKRKGDDVDFNKWAAQFIADNTDPELIEGSNIIDIKYNSDRPEVAKKIADAVRVAYTETSLDERREAARRNADWYDQQAQRAKGVVEQAEGEKSAYERENGILLQDDKTDIDSARLAALANQGGAQAIVSAGAGGSSPAALQLAQLDASISQASSVLGPNHPELVEMRRKRELLAKQAAEERNAMASASGASAQAARATAGLLDAQKSKVLAQRDKVEHLRLLQDNVNLQRDQYTKAAARAAELRQEAEVVSTSITALGAAITPNAPVFPNKPLILLGSLGLGTAGGVVIALLLEILVRRVRSAEDLRSTVDAPVLTVLRNQATKDRPQEPRPPRRPKPKLVGKTAAQA